MKKLLILIILILFCGCSINSRINEEIEISNRNCKVIEDVDTHGGFLGDGEYFAKIKCKNLSKKDLSKNWKILPMPRSITDVLSVPFCDERGCKTFYERYNIKTDTKGYYYFYDRYSNYEDRYNDHNLNTRSSYNFDIAIYDIEENIIYYYKLDT